MAAELAALGVGRGFAAELAAELAAEDGGQEAEGVDDDGLDPAERERRRQAEAEELRRKLITEIAANWEASQEESKRKHKALALLIEAKEEEKQRKAELLQRKANKPEPVPPPASLAEHPLVAAAEERTWKQRWLADQRIQQVYTSSKLLSKTKKKLKEAGRRAEEAAEAELVEAEEEKNPPPVVGGGVIGSIQEYAELVGKSVKQLAEAVFEPPEPSSSSEGSGGEEEEDGSLWGTILGGTD